MIDHEQVTDAAAAASAAAAATGAKVSWTGGGVWVLGWLFSNEFAVVAGVVIAAIGLFVNWYYKHKEDKRGEREVALKQAEFEAEQRRLDAEHEKRMGQSRL